MVFIASVFLVSSKPTLADSTIIQNPSNKHWYQRFDTSMGWYAAKTFCERRGGYLATITSQDENDFVWNYLASKATNTGGIWLGATNDKTSTGTYQWITGEKWNYTNWNIGEPNNAETIPGGGEHYLEFLSASQNPNGVWNDISSYNQGSAWMSVGYRETVTICEWRGGGSWNF